LVKAGIRRELIASGSRLGHGLGLLPLTRITLSVRNYARIRDDKPTETRFAEIKLRAVIKIGELSRELETIQGQHVPIDGQKSKAEQLREVGISHATAQRYEQLAGPRRDLEVIGRKIGLPVELQVLQAITQYVEARQRTK
jgi:hypothetical protein